VLPALRARWVAAHGAGPLSEPQHALLGLLCGYADVLAPGTPLASYSREVLPVLALHAAQHLVLCQKLLQRHAKKGLTPQDQGFTKPKVLVLLPFRAHALSFVRALLALLPDCYEQVENKARFFQEYSEEEGSAPMPASKPADYKLLFDGNNDDCFRCALRLTRKAAKLYASFYSADLVIASPLGLKLGLAEGKKSEGKVRKKGGEPDTDWLSSLEMVLMPYADVLLMQNWAHIVELFDHANRLPTEQRDTDFSRVRPYFLDGNSRQLRQTAVLAAHPAPELSALVNRTCTNAAGRVALEPRYDGCLGRVPQGVRQLCVRFDCVDPAAESDARIAAFKARLLPSLLTAMSASVGVAQTLLFVPRYLDFVRVRTLLQQEDVPFVAISEYSTASQVSRARDALQRREVPLLMYTERAHFFRRHKLRGARHLAVYSPPSYAEFYLELLQMLDRSSERGADSTSVLLFSRLDLLPLQRLVGTERASRMLNGHESSFLFTDA
jgi:U3 small nucleolar RNA-associated protein 25